MFTTVKIESTIKPQKFESLNNGMWYYNYDITEKSVFTKDANEQVVEEARYEYVQVRIKGTPTLTKCYEAILKTYKDENGIVLYDAIRLGASEDLIEDIYEAVKVDFGVEVEPTPLEKAKKVIIRKINEHDSSPEVNSFFLNGLQVWLNKDTRVGLMNSLTIEKNAGKEDSTLWFNNICVVVKCDAAMQMLSALELYALECYNRTAEHKVAVQNLMSEEEVANYDYTTGYPDKLRFTIE